jgi:Ribbon-helix-helix protein, copG family
MRTTVRIDETLYRRVKAEAARTGRTVSQLLEDSLREALRPRPVDNDLPPLVTFGGSGVLPGVDLADVGRLRELMDEGTPVDALR